MKRLALKLALAFAAAFALTATPVLACENCKDCPEHKTKAEKAAPKAEKKEAKPAEKAAPAAPVAGEKKAEGEKKCECTKDGKGCTCKKGECKCANCGAAKMAAGDEKPKCECGKGKDCACKKGECKCQHDAKRAA